MSGPSSGPDVHVLVYTDAEVVGGAEMTMAKVLGGLPPRFTVTVVAIDGVSGDSVPRWIADHRPGTEFRQLPRIDGAKDVRGMWAHRRLYAELAPDVMHFNLSLMPSCQWALATALTRRTPVLVVENSPMGSWSKPSNLLKRVTSKRAQAHVAVGERTARMIEESAGLPAGSVGTLYHGVPEVARDIPREPHDGPIIVNVARHDLVKGIDVLLHAMTHLPDDVALVQIGGGPSTDELVALRRELGLEHRVEFRDLPWEQRAADQLAGFDLFVLPSRIEGLPVTIMEAMLAGRAIVSTDVGSVREQITDGETGLIVAPEDPEALAAAIAELLADPDRRAEMGRRNRETAERLFTVEATVERYVTLYDGLVANTGRPLPSTR
ncbi:MAG TPA: glycosyltransferase family 4 protein [Microthrixaceae bacterium]|nr:glycosyltransferase family 4 protein [Microthrixaceae bacterium]